MMGSVPSWLAPYLPQIIAVILLIPSIVLHEMGHGFAAYKLGDPTAKNAGRLSFNPARHVDLFGSIILPLALVAVGGPIIGFAKPVPYDPRYFKNLRQGEVIVGLAGPAVNFLLALVGSFVCFVGQQIFGANPVVGYWVFFVGYYFAYINLMLMFFNLLPIPPLDGSSIIAAFLPNSAMPTYYKIQQYALFVLIILLIVVPYVAGFNPIGVYIDATAGRLLDIIVPW